jgi:hypothetical protein
VGQKKRVLSREQKRQSREPVRWLRDLPQILCGACLWMCLYLCVLVDGEQQAGG